ncbi:MAG: adenosine deaminase family protein [Verrucomicrobia bacterium]|nr:adenosine deaminase family protein [Verrucomicrobiota bacterium]
MGNTITSEFIHQIPKTDLHVHLDGSLRLSTLIELAGKCNVELPASDEKGMKKEVFKETYADLPEYLKGFSYTVAVLQSPDHLARVARELVEDNIAEGVRYIEVRFAPQLHSRDDFTVDEVVKAVCKGLDEAKNEFNASDAVRKGDDIPFEYGIIACALRRFNQHMSPYYACLFEAMPHAPLEEVFSAASLDLVRAAADMRYKQGLPVVGFDLAGEESGYPAGDHRAAFQYAQTHFIRKTVHAGEAYGPESIFQAITDCHANRIGHGTFLFADNMIQDPEIEDPKAYVEHLAEYIASRRITIEVNLTSNLQTIPAIRSVADHSLRQMLERNMSVSICTDNRLVSQTSVSHEIELAVEHIPMTPRQLRNVIVAGFKGSFFPSPYNEKRSYVRNAINRYEKLAEEHGIE